MFALLISMARFKSISFHQNSPKIKIFLQKNAKFSSVGGFGGLGDKDYSHRRQGDLPPDLLVSGGCSLCPLDPTPPAVGGLVHRPPMTLGGSAPRLPKQPLIANFWLRTFKRG